jgi:hypothetical protein
MVQVIEHLPSKHEVLSSNLGPQNPEKKTLTTTTKKQKQASKI